MGKERWVAALEAEYDAHTTPFKSLLYTVIYFSFNNQQRIRLYELVPQVATIDQHYDDHHHHGKVVSRVFGHWGRI